MFRARCRALLVITGWLALSCGSGERIPVARMSEDPAGADPPGVAAEGPGHWPSFRGPDASGVAPDGQSLPRSWNAETGENIRFKVRIPGLAHSSPVIWGDRLFVTSAVSGRGEATFKPGLYGSGEASDDLSEHRWVVLALDKRTGEILWERTAHSGVPRDKRHIKATYANSSPAVDGRYVVVLFGSEGLYAYDLDGNLAWKKDLGRLDLGAYDAPDYEWGSASSPVIYRDLVIVQCDTQAESFVLAADLHSGETVWKVDRDEPPSWGTPTVVPWPGGDVLVTNASRFIRGYEPSTGREIFRLGGSSMITAPTPIFDPTGLVVVASGRRPEKPLFAIRPGAHGDITLRDGETSNAHVAWSRTKRGPYMPTPLLHDGRLYVLNNDGIFAAYEVADGTEIFRERIPHSGGGFSASPVAADGRIYLPGEDGDVFVVKAARELELVGRNPVFEPIMATPAISQGLLYLRAEQHLYAIGK